MSHDANVEPTTVVARVVLPPAMISTRHHAWVTWAQIAIAHEALARTRYEARDVYEFRPGLVAVTASAFALDALNAVGKGLLPAGSLPAAGAGCRPKGSRGRRVAEVLKRGVSPGKLAATWSDRIDTLFETRRDAVHFGESDQVPVWHPGLNSNVSPEVRRWGAEAASAAVDLMLEVMAAWADHPSDPVRAWAVSFSPAVRDLESLRASS